MKTNPPKGIAAEERAKELSMSLSFKKAVRDALNDVSKRQNFPEDLN